MAGTTSVPAAQFTPEGLVVPTEVEIKVGVFADWNAAFGGSLNPQDSSPQGQLITSQTAIIGDKNSSILGVVNGVDPATSSGFMQDAIGRIYFMTRLPALSTVVDVTCSGLTGTVIPAGSLVRDSANNIYVSDSAGTIGVGGTTIIQFSAQQTGPLDCPPGAIQAVPVKIISGWDSAANLTAGIVGRDVESRADFEFRRRQSVAINGRGTIPSIYANVFDVEGVTDVYALDNPSGLTVSKGVTNYPMIPHSIYVGVVGGNNQDVAEAIWRFKDVGADYNGNTTVTVTDDSGYNVPLPTYQVKFNRPTATPIKFAVQLSNNGTLPVDIITQVKNAIIAAFSGSDGTLRARIGSTIYASQFYAPIIALGPSVSILSLLIGIGSPTVSSVTMGIDQAPTVTAADITVTLI